MAIKTDTPLILDEAQAIVKRVIRENWRIYFRQYLIAGLLLGLVAASTAFTAYIIKNITNDVFVRQDLQAAYTIALAIFVVFTIRGFATYGYMYILGKIGNSIVARYQRRIFQHLLKLGIQFHKSNRSAYLIGQINQNILGMRTMMNDVVIVFVRDLFTLIALIAVMVIQDWFMSIVSLAVMPVIAYIMSRYVRRIRKVARQEVDLNARVNSALIENSQGMEIVKAFTMEDQMMDKMRTLTQQAEIRSNRIVQLNAKTKPPTEILAGFAIAGVVAFGGYRVALEGHDPGALFSFLTAAMLAYEPARKLASFRVAFERSLVNARMLYEVLDLPPRQADKPGASDLEVTTGELRFENIRFSYTDGEPVLDDVSITAPAGKTIALVGPSGGGKSTLIMLAQRFFDPASGRILIDEHDIADVTASSLRTNIAYVSQQPMLFEGSIMENIRYGRPDASDEEVYEAAKLAQAHQFVLEQPQGYDTAVGELGGNLSGGQRQRLSIARAFLRDAPVLLLDEATSALDNESELLVQRALEQLVKGRTTIVIAHRLSTIRNADRIFVIENGRVTQEGTHSSLMRKKTGTYARLHGIGTGTVANRSSERKTAS
ncbi:MAG: ABC transporter ATP-binding protein [Rhizobiaceae bacterium]|nr:ABC transporter ATP-binding protein [Rhizobiaceae bacterium]